VDTLAMLPLADYLKITVAMLVILNPLGVVPIFAVMTRSNTTAERMRIARIAAFTVGLVLVVSALVGDTLLNLFGITIASFKVGGAILILLTAVSMMQASVTREKQTPEEAREAEDKASIAVVPLAIPLLAGPGAISASIIYAADMAGPAHRAAIVGCGVAAALVTWISLRIASRIARFMSTTVVNILVRLMGLVLAALAAEIFTSGLKVLLPGLAGALK
jgi:multiple antibiotic resistance protein